MQMNLLRKVSLLEFRAASSSDAVKPMPCVRIGFGRVGASEPARPYGGASIGINVKRSRGAKGSETDETSPTRRAVCGKTARTVR